MTLVAEGLNGHILIAGWIDIAERARQISTLHTMFLYSWKGSEHTRLCVADGSVYTTIAVLVPQL